MKLYPLKFKSIFKYRIWGGDKFESVLNKKIIESSIGESWEISGVSEDETLVADGELKGETLKSLINKYKEDFIGKGVYEQFGDKFPLLIKFIDTAQPLSIQVHPNDAVAKERNNSFGKNELWYIMEAEENAELIVGFRKKCNKKDFQKKIDEGNVLEVLNNVKASKGAAFYIPAGRIHAIGGGIMLA